MSREGALWIGGLETYMDEDFIQKALHMMGEVNLLSIKVIKNKFTGGAAGYGFINFISDQVALTCMHKLNGKIIPNTNPPVRFKLNHNSNRLLPGEKNHSIWVGDLTPEVDDLQLYKFFSARFQSIISAKVVLDESGFSKGFGFIRFGNEQEQQTAMTSMMGVAGLGGKPIKVSIAVQKDKSKWDSPQTMEIPAHLAQTVAQSVIGGGTNSQSQYPAQPSQPEYNSAEYYNQYSQYWSQYAAWQQYQQQWQQYQEQQAKAAPTSTVAPPPPVAPAPSQSVKTSETSPLSLPVPAPPSRSPSESKEPPTNGEKRKIEETEEESMLIGPPSKLVDHLQKEKLDYRSLNNKFLNISEEVFRSIEQSRWWYLGED
jgi:RNA recognition motif-containing protein